MCSQRTVAALRYNTLPPYTPPMGYVSYPMARTTVQQLHKSYATALSWVALLVARRRSRCAAVQLPAPIGADLSCTSNNLMVPAWLNPLALVYGKALLLLRAAQVLRVEHLARGTARGAT